ncbi:MAG: hypothetical protein Tsb0016_27760 [Sphingomonadales bacterium]
MDRDAKDNSKKEAPSLTPTQARQGEVIIDTRPKQRRMVFYVIILVLALALLFLAIG